MEHPSHETAAGDTAAGDTAAGDTAAGLPDRPPHVRVIAMPADTNPAGDIFGGWLMAQMDLAAGNAAARRARGRCATVAVDKMTFHRPVLVGDEVSFYATIEKVGRTSMIIKVEAWRRSRDARRQRPRDGGHVHLRGDRWESPPSRDPACRLRASFRAALHGRGGHRPTETAAPGRHGLLDIAA